ncbi:hypothetical protein BLOT_001170 [Blomia tropicalis]|nr:hypothetical protein BLOT_001170 [Blomia tropicalis]
MYSLIDRVGLNGLRLLSSLVGETQQLDDFFDLVVAIAFADRIDLIQFRMNMLLMGTGTSGA